MTVTFSYHEELPRRQLSEADLSAEEQQLGVRLPVEYRTFLLAHDAATPDPAWFRLELPTGNSEWHGPILFFFSTEAPPGNGQGRACCLWSQAWQFREYQKLPPHYLPVAQIGTVTRENFLLVSVAEADRGSVYLWRAANKRFRRDQLKRVAGSFDAFLTRLQEPPGDIREENERILLANHEGRFRRPLPDFYEGPEAGGWLTRNRNPAPLAANHFLFKGKNAARDFIRQLYAAGATRVLIPEDHIQDNDDEGPYADALVVFLPTAVEARKRVCRLCEGELEEPEVFDANDPTPIFLWWD